MGRNRKTNVMRDAAGRSRGESPEQAMGVALAARARRMGDVPTELAGQLARHELSGTVLGLLTLRWQFSRSPETKLTCPMAWRLYALAPEHAEAAKWYGDVIRRHAAVMGYRIDSYVSHGRGGGDFPPDVAAEIKSDFRAAFKVLMGVGLAVATSTYDLSVDRLTLEQAEANMLAIKLGLHTLGTIRRQPIAKSARI